MYYLTKKIDMVASHAHGDGQKVHFHTFSIMFFLKSPVLNSSSRICPVENYVGNIRAMYEGKCLNDVVKEYLPTLENMAYILCHMMPTCYKVTINDGECEQATFMKEVEK